MDVEPALGNAEVLGRVVPRLLAAPAAQVIDARAERLVRGDGQGLGVYRVSGTARSGDATRSWSAIVKVLGTAAGFARDHWCYPGRELLAYRSGLVADLPGGLESPQFLAAERDRAGRWCLWLEDLGTQDDPWTIEDHAWAARCLGRFNGAYLTGVPIPELGWLSRDWLRGWLAETAAAVADLPRHRDHPVVARVYPADVVAGIAGLWEDRERLLAALDRLPPTLCHNDAFRRNLARRGDRLVGLDWAFLGPGPIGAELSPLISAALATAEVAPREQAALERAAVSGYLAGLRDSGWHGSPDDVWLGYTATSALRYGCGTVRIVLPTLLEPSLREHAAAVIGLAFDAVLDLWAAVIRSQVELHARAVRRLT